MEKNKYANKKVLVLGLAKSGYSAAVVLHQLGAIVTVNDGKGFEENREAQQLLALGIRVITGSHPIELLDEDFELMVKNPGIPYNNPMVEKALEKNIEVITEVELAHFIAKATIVGVTGTNGKTTTTTMIANLLNGNKKEPLAFVAGNIGEVASRVAQTLTRDQVMVTELSSFQLMGIEEFHPKIAVITNLFEAHLDYHHTREEYVSAKWQIQKNMTKNDLLILNYNQNEMKNLAKQTKATVLPFSTEGQIEEGVYVKNGNIYLNEEKIMPVSSIGVPGSHNVENALAAIAVAKQFEIPNESIEETLRQFSGVEHRMEFVGFVHGRKVYNDSKATNVLATKKALDSFSSSEPSTILIAGGLDRGNDFHDLESSLKNVKAGFFYGEARGKLAESAEIANVPTISIVEELDEAIQLAFQASNPQDIILFSPACASWDQFKNFEVRGQHFKNKIKKIEEEWGN